MWSCVRLLELGCSMNDDERAAMSPSRPHPLFVWSGEVLRAGQVPERAIWGHGRTRRRDLLSTIDHHSSTCTYHQFGLAVPPRTLAGGPLGCGEAGCGARGWIVYLCMAMWTMDYLWTVDCGASLGAGVQMLAYWHIGILGGLADWQIAIYIQSPAKTCVHSGRGEVIR